MPNTKPKEHPIKYQTRSGKFGARLAPYALGSLGTLIAGFFCSYMNQVQINEALSPLQCKQNPADYPDYDRF